MKSYSSSVSPKGQITLPLEIRKCLGIKPKDTVIITLEGENIKIISVGSRLAASFGAVPALKKPLTWEEITETAWEEHSQKVASEGL